jgi:predicted ArsR family transcriptional regulator
MTEVAVRRLRDPRELRALAHPVRIGLMELLGLDGPMTATELAERLGETPANCSWHLRKLAEHGFVEEAEGGRGRQRPWQAASIGHSWGEDDASPEELAAGGMLQDVVMDRALARLHDSRRLRAAAGAEWRESATASQSATWLTPEELDEINQEVRAVIMRHVDRLTDPAKRPEGSRLCELVAWGVPVQFGTVAQR